MMEAAGTSETSINFYQTTWHNNPEDGHFKVGPEVFPSGEYSLLMRRTSFQENISTTTLCESIHSSHQE
jgi:hypothetical protein